ncbi:hypothetical protein [Mycobacterium sp.]|uniref:hypothetical protein n=1 Tax=Mycobacterium sp. TaxID=1785 RepID=UPI003F9CAA0E
MSDNPDPAHGSQPFFDASNTPSDFGRSTNSNFRGKHVYPGVGSTHVAKIPAGAGLTGWEQPEG